MAQKIFGNLVKAVVDIEREVAAIDGELHADLMEFLVEQGSKPESIWGINIYPEVETDDWIEFDSVINLKPLVGNRNRSVENPETREKILSIISRFIKK